MWRLVGLILLAACLLVQTQGQDDSTWKDAHTNIAHLNGTATQTGTLLVQSSGQWLNASLAIDGNTSQEWNTNYEMSMSHTRVQDVVPSIEYAWWRVDFPRMAFISNITIYDRKTCEGCEDRIIGMSVLIGGFNYSTIDNNKTKIINFTDINRYGRFVEMKQTRKDNNINLPEVLVYGELLCESFNVTNGSPSFYNYTRAGGTQRVSCERQYIPIGDNPANCLPVILEWENELPACKKLRNVNVAFAKVVGPATAD